MVLGALATTSAFGQNRHKPVVPPTPPGVKYKSYLTSYMKENSDFQDKMLFTLNSGLRNFQSETVVIREHLESVIVYTRFVDTTITFFQNSFRMDSVKGPIYFYLQETYTGIVGVVNISGVLIVWIKKDCGNILICTPVMLQIATIPKPAPAPAPVPTPAPEPKPKPEESEEEKRRQARAQEVHLSQRSSFDYSHSNANEIEVLEVEEGAQFSIGLSGGGYSYNGQSQGPFGASCETSSGGHGGLAVGYKAPSSTKYYRNSSASSSNTSTSNSSSASVNQGGNSGNQNQNQQAKKQGSNSNCRYCDYNNNLVGQKPVQQGYNIATTAE